MGHSRQRCDGVIEEDTELRMSKRSENMHPTFQSDSALTDSSEKNRQGQDVAFKHLLVPRHLRTPPPTTISRLVYLVPTFE